MKSKFVTCIAITAAFVAGGTSAVASPTENSSVHMQSDVKLLGAQIENAIAELPGDRTHQGIQNAAYFVLAKQEAPIDVKIAAIDTVIDHAQSIGDQQVVEALNRIEFNEKNSDDANVSENTVSISVPVRRKTVPVPPRLASSGGSDY